MSAPVTVLIPARDAAQHLAATLHSLDLCGGIGEVVVVDDGSTDGTWGMLEAWAGRSHHPVRLARIPVSGGIVGALNRGLALAKFPFVARLDADDIVHPQRFVLQLAAMQRHRWDLCGTGVRAFPTQAISGGLRRYVGWQNAQRTGGQMALSRFIESPLVHPSVMFRRDVVRAVGGYRMAGWSEDYDLWLRLWERGASVGKVPQILTGWRDHPQRLTRTADYCRADRFAACKAHFLMRQLPTGRYWIAGPGRDGKRLHHALAREGGILAGWIDVNPRRVGQVLHGARVRRLESARLQDGDVVLVTVGAAGGRKACATVLEAWGLREGVEYWCCA